MSGQIHALFVKIGMLLRQEGQVEKWYPHSENQNGHVLKMDVEDFQGDGKLYRIEIREVEKVDRSVELIKAVQEIKGTASKESVQSIFDLLDDHRGRTK